MPYTFTTNTNAPTCYLQGAYNLQNRMVKKLLVIHSIFAHTFTTVIGGLIETKELTMEETVKGYGDNATEIIDQIIELVTIYGLKVIGAIVILIIGFWLSKKIRGWVVKGLEKSGKSEPTLNQFLGSLVYYIAILITIVAVLGQFGIETTSFIAVLGALGLAIGLALQGTLSHVASGVMLMIFRPFKVGHFVEVAGHTGTVKALTLFTTDLDTGDNKRIIIPNGAVWGSSLVNYSFNDKRRIDFVFGIGYGDDINKAMDIIKGLAAADDRIHKDPEPFLVVSCLNDFSVDLTLRVWSESSNYWGIYFGMQKAVKEAFDAAGIDIPYPQTVVHQAG